MATTAKVKKTVEELRALKPHGYDVVATPEKHRTSDNAIKAVFAGWAVLALLLPFLVIPAGVLLFVFYLVWNQLKYRGARKSYYSTVTEEDVAVPDGTPVRKGLRVCVVGAGPSGLVTAKELLDENHEVVVYEMHHTFGGVFLYAEDKGGVYDSTLLTISNYLMAFSDYFKLGDSCRYWHHTEYFDYLKGYVENFKLTSRARFNFNTRVVSLKRKGDKWVVKTEGAVEEETEFDAVAVCSGTHQQANWPDFPGQKETKIHLCHSETFKRAKTDGRFDGKRVVVVGGGETAADVAAEISDAASAAWISFRRPPYVVPRNMWGLGHPADTFSTRSMFYGNHNIIERVHAFDGKLKHATGTSALGQAVFRGAGGLGDPVSAKVWDMAKHSGGGVAQQFLTKNDAFVVKLVEGKLTEKPGIERFEPNTKTIYFTDGTKVSDVDTVLFCTGYRDEFPFLNEVVSISAVRELYKHAFHPDLGTSIAWIGFVRPSTGGVPACSEIVARYWSLILSNKRKLPDNWKERIVEERKVEESLFHLGRVKTLVFWGDYIENLALHVGCAPKLFSIFFTNPVLWYRLFFGSMIPAQFRLKGPHAKPEFAKKVVEDVALATPPPFKLVQAVGAVTSWIGGVFNYKLHPSW